MCVRAHERVKNDMYLVAGYRELTLELPAQSQEDALASFIEVVLQTSCLQEDR